MSTLCLKKCKLIDGQTTDILIVDEKIKYIGNSLQAEQTIDCTGKIALPGVIDMHVHFRVPGDEQKEDWRTGSAAAAAGGVTSVIDMPNTTPPTIDETTLIQKRSIADQDSLINYGFYLGATNDNYQKINKIKNIAGVKIYVGSSTGNLLVADDASIKNFLLIPNTLVVLHAEDETIINNNMEKYGASDDPAVHSKIRNRQAAVRAVKRVIKLAKETGGRIHICHVSTREEITLIAQAKEENVSITSEVSPHHLFLNESAYTPLKNYVRVNPPLRTTEDNEALWQGLRDGVIDVIATDHAPHTRAEKEQIYRQAASGIPEIQTSLPLMLDAVHEKKITLAQLVEVMAEKPAKLLHLKNKGKLAVGYDADITIIDAALTKTITANMLKSKCSWSPYEGRTLVGWPVMTLVNGKVIYNNDAINNKYKGKELTYGTV